MSIYLLVDIGSTYTKLTAVDTDKQDIIATSRHFTTVETDVRIGYHKALELIKKKIGDISFDKIVACSSAAGGLKMCAIGLVEELTVEAARRVCLGAGGKVDLVYSHYINLSDAEHIKTSKIDIILLAGGTDGGNRDSVLHNATILGEAGVKIPVVYAGNRACQDEIKAIFQKYQLNGVICENVMPRLNHLYIDSAKEAIKNIFLTHIVEAKGIKTIEKEIDQVLLPTPKAVLKAAELLSKGYLNSEGLGDLLMVDIGGATTDVYSIGSGSPKSANVILRGLEEPFSKRTVEGDLGMRYSATGIIKNLSEEQIKLYAEQGIDLVKEANYRYENVASISKDEREIHIDKLLGEICSDIAISRHVGKLESVYTPLGVMYYQTGKDLTEVKYVIGTGGVIIYGEHAKDILKRCCYDRSKPLELRPKNPYFFLDFDYILSAMGLLSISHPEVALKIMKNRIKLI